WMKQTQIATGAATRIRVRGSWLLAIRIVWPLVLFFGYIGPYALSLPAVYIRYHRVCDGCAFTPGAAAALARLDVSLEAYAWLAVALTATILVISFTLGLIALWRSDELISLLTSALIMIVTVLISVAEDTTLQLSYILPAEFQASLNVL